MHIIEIPPAPQGADPEAHDAEVRETIFGACEEHGAVELHYPQGAPDVARIVDGELLVVAK